MNSLKFSKFFKIALIIGLALIIGAGFVIGFLGFNKSVDYTGSYVVEVEVDQNFGDNKAVIKDVSEKFFKDNGVKVKNVKEQDDGRIVVYQVNKELSAEKLTLLQDKLSAKVTEVELDVTGYEATTIVNMDELTYALIGVAITLAVTYIYMAFRYKWASSLAIVVSILFELCLFVALMALTRVVTTPAIFASAFIGVVITAVSSILFAAQAKKALKEDGKKDVNELSDSITNDLFKLNVIMLVIAVVLGLAFIILGTSLLKWMGAQVILSAVSAVLTNLFITGGLWQATKKIRKAKKYEKTLKENK